MAKADSTSPRSAVDTQSAQNAEPNSPLFEPATGPEDATPKVWPSQPSRDSPSPGGDESQNSAGSESDLDLNTGNSKLKALVAEKRAARHAAERAAKEKRRAAAKALAQRTPTIEIDESGDEGEDERDAGRSFTQQSKPTRKASKKALEEINRETQRIARNQQLAHQMQVKKKITKQDLFKRFNFNTAAEPTTEKHAEDKSEEESFMMSGALQSSDVETDHPETLPTSPISEGKPDTKAGLASHQPRVDDGMEITTDPQSAPVPKDNIPMERNSTKKPLTELAANVAAASDNSDDDLEIVFTKPKATAILDQLPSNKARLSKPMITLMHLANLTSPSKTRGKGKNLTSKELQVKLLQDARKQARQAKEERINELRARGIHVQTAEEREKEQLDLENLLEKARQDAEVLAKKEKGEDGEDGSDDEEWAEPNETDPEMSGSDADDADDEDGESEAGNPFFDQEAEDTDEESEAELEDLESMLHKQSSSGAKNVDSTKAPRTRNRRVILDDDQDDELPSSASQKADAIAAAGLGKSNTMDFGLSQIFAGTLADETQSGTNVDQEQHFVTGELATPGVASAMDFASRLVPDSQTAGPKLSLPQLDLSLSQFPSQPIESPSKMSDMEFTQDVGFAIPRAPIGRRDMPASTSETVLLDTPDKKGKLRRKASLVAVLSDADDDDVDAPDAFDTLFRGAKRRAEAIAFDKKKSAARNLVEEQAEESEDEYKGIGGASDDESNGEYDEEVAQMIDEGHVDVDEMEIAALHAYVHWSPGLPG
jgi:mediator of replication checkpoint protein 1